MSASYNPPSKLFFVATSDGCGFTRVIPAPFEMGSRYFNGSGSFVPGGTRSIRAIDTQTGKTVWDYVQSPDGRSAAGTFSTNGGLVCVGGDSGVFTALDGKTGKPLFWHFPANQSFRASPMTYMAGGKQYVSIAGPAGFLTFGLADR